MAHSDNSKTRKIMTIKINWGIKIAILYIGFVALIITLVVASSHQHFDLVSANYYADEIAYQKVIDAGKNLSTPIAIHANEHDVVFEIPAELNGRQLSGYVQFYSPANSAWDRKFDIHTTDKTFSIDRTKLEHTNYIVKINIIANNKKYYQEATLNLYQR